MKFVRSWGVSIGMFLGMVAIAFVALSTTPDEAEAGCSSTKVCTRSGGYSSCRTSSVCSAPRVRTCTMVNRCTPQRTCVTRGRTTSCVTRDVCRRTQVCN